MEWYKGRIGRGGGTMRRKGAVEQSVAASSRRTVAYPTGASGRNRKGATVPRPFDDIQQGLTDAARPWTWGVIVVAAGVASATLYARIGYLLVDVNPGLSDIAVDVFGKYLLLVVAVERAATVFVGMFRNRNNVNWSLRIDRIREVLEKEDVPTAVLKQVHARERRLIKKLEALGIIASIDDVSGSAADDYRGYLTSAKHAYEFQRARFNSVSSRYIALVVFVVGVMLASLGLSLFRDLFQQTPAPGAVQAAFLRLADIFVTGGLLGGGSAGLNAVVTKVTDYANRK